VDGKEQKSKPVVLLSQIFFSGFEPTTTDYFSFNQIIPINLTTTKVVKKDLMGQLIFKDVEALHPSEKWTNNQNKK
jgi:hypothetical protein